MLVFMMSDSSSFLLFGESENESQSDDKVFSDDELQLNNSATTNSDVECMGVQLPGSPSPKRQQKTLLDYFDKRTHNSSHHEYTELL